MEGIPTMYHGRLFRSRLEARWAVIFDLLGWRYEYEPYDLNGWVPDFVLRGADEIIVEVKPYILLKEFDTEKILTGLKGTRKWGKEILLLGYTIWEDSPLVILGYLGEFYLDRYGFSRAVLNCYKGWGFYHETGIWRDRITGLYDGDHYLRNPDYSKVLEFWDRAGNTVQYKARRVWTNYKR